MWAATVHAPKPMIFYLKKFISDGEVIHAYWRGFSIEIKWFRNVMNRYFDPLNFRPGHFFPGDMILAQSTWPLFGIVRITDESTGDVQPIPNIRVTTKPIKSWSAYRLSKKNRTGNSCKPSMQRSRPEKLVKTKSCWMPPLNRKKSEVCTGYSIFV